MSVEIARFYASRGYSAIGELPDVPAGSKRQWFCKVLEANTP
jgi:hypothetical protein